MSVNRAEQLQFLRFLAFFFIFTWHAEMYTPSWFPAGTGANCSVSLFFILSGLAKAYSSYNNLNEFSIKSIFDNLKRKIKKVYPLFFITTLVTLVYSEIPISLANHDFMKVKSLVIQLMKNLLLIQSWFDEGYFSFNGVSWFLSTIMFLYLLEPLLIAIAVKIKNKKNNIVFFIAILFLSLGLSFLYSYLLRNADVAFWLYVFPPARMGEFVSGICLGYIVRLVNEKRSFDNKVIFTILELIALILWVSVIYLAYINYSSGIQWLCRFLLWLLPNYLLLFVFAVGKGYLSKLFCLYPLKRLGDISFECFLLHQIIIVIYSTMSLVSNISLIGNYFSLILCLSITLLIANGIAKRN